MLKRVLVVALGVAATGVAAGPAAAQYEDDPFGGPPSEERPDDADDAADDDGEAVPEAEQGPDYSKVGWYVQLGVVHGHERNLEDEIDEKRDAFAKSAAQGPPPRQLGDVDISTSPGVNLRFGRRILPHAAIELQFEYMGDFGVEIENYGTIRSETYSFTVNMKFPLLTGRIQPYALVGAGATWAYADEPFPPVQVPSPPASGNPSTFEELVDARGVGAVFRLASGLDFYFTENLAFQGEVAWVPSQGDDVNDIRYIGVGWSLLYRF